MKLEVIKAIQAIGDIKIAFEHQFTDSEDLKRPYSDQELEELLLALKIYREPKEVMKDKSFVDSFCERNNRTRTALSQKLYNLRKEKSTR